VRNSIDRRGRGDVSCRTEKATRDTIKQAETVPAWKVFEKVKPGPSMTMGTFGTRKGWANV